MFLGHFGLGFGAKKYAPQVSLGTLLLAAQFLDLLWPIFLLLGIETVSIGGPKPPGLIFTSYPYTHSLLFVLGWAALFGLVYYWRKKNVRAAVVLGLLVISHWLLDLLVHTPDLPLYTGGPVVGMGLWSISGLELIVEIGLFVVGFSWYLLATRAKNLRGMFGVWALALFLVGSHLANIFGPPPPSASMIAWAGNLMWLFVLLAYWVDKHREIRVPRTSMQRGLSLRLKRAAK